MHHFHDTNLLVLATLSSYTHAHKRRGVANDQMAENFTTVPNLQRKPSVLSVLETITEGRPSSRAAVSDGEVQSWEWWEVAAWLAEIGMVQYQV